MELPEGTEDRGYLEWNYLVRGMVQVWELARLVGMDRKLEEQLAGDRDGVLFEVLGRAGNECSSLMALLQGRMEARHHDAEVGALGAPSRAVIERLAVSLGKTGNGAGTNGSGMHV